jgi:RHS repeat-associated protein
MIGRGSTTTDLASDLVHKTDAATYGSGALTESFHPVAAGIEQSFHVAARPHGNGAVTIDVPISGLITSSGPSGVVLRDGTGRAVATYSGLRVTDARGRVVSASMAPAQGGRGIVITAHDAGALYPLSVDPTWSTPSADIYVSMAGKTQPVNATTGVAGTTAPIGGNQLFIGPGSTLGWATNYAGFGSMAYVTPVNLATGAVGTGVGVGTQTGSASVLSPNGQFLYMSNWGTNSITVFSTVTGQVATTLYPASSTYAPYGLAVSPNNQTLWMEGVNSVTPFNLSTGTSGAEITIPDAPSPATPEGLTMSSNGETLYATYSWGFVPINTATGAVGPEISVAINDLEPGVGFPNEEGLALTPNGQSGYVIDDSTTVTPVNLVTDTVGTPISLAGLANGAGENLDAVAVSSNGQTAYVLSQYGYLDTINLSTDALGAPITLAENTYDTDLTQEPPATVVPQGAVLGADTIGGGSKSEGCETCGIPATKQHGDPVDTATGDFSDSATDLNLPGAGIPLDFTRTYDAQAAQAEVTAGQTAGPLGYGWSDNLGMSLSYNSSTQSATVTEENGAQTAFNQYVSGSANPWCSSSYNFCAAAPRIEATLNQNSGGTWTYTRLTGTPETFTFSSSGTLTQVADAGGDTLSSSSYSPSGGQTACPGGDTCTAWTSSASGRELVLAVNSSSQLVEVFDANSSLAASFSYSGSGCSSWSGSQTPDLCSAVDPGGITATYTYDSGNATADFDYDMLTETPPGASGQTTNVYNSSGQVAQQSDPAGGVSTYAYAGTNSSVVGGTTTITTYPDGAGSGEPTDVTFDTYSSNALVGETTGYGTANAVTTTIYRDPASLMPIAVTDGNGNSTTSTYQTYSGTGGTTVSSANVLTSTDALGNTTAHAYTASNQVWCTVDAADYTNAKRCPSTEPTSPPAPGASDPNLGMTIAFYNAAGQVTATTDALGNTTTYSFTSGVSGVPNGLLYCAVDPADYQKSVTCPAYGAAHVTGTTTDTYDSAGDKTSSTNADGDTTTYAYAYASTHPGLASSETDPSGTTTTYTYNGTGEVTNKTVSFGSATSTTLNAYDSYGRIYCTVAPLEAAQGVTCPASPPSPSSPPANLTSTFYDADGRVTQTTNPLGGTSLTAYDGTGLVYCTVSPAEYAASVRCPSTEPTSPPTIGSDPYVGTTITTYDAAAQVVQVTNPLGGIKLSTYDAAGNLISTTLESNNATAAPNVVTAYTYDADDRVVSKTLGSGSSQPETTLKSYDPNGNDFCTVSPNTYARGTSAYQCPVWQSSWVAAPPSPTSLYSSTPTSAQANNVTTTFANAQGTVVQSSTPDVATTVSALDADARTYCTSDPTNVAAYLTAHPSATYPYDCPTAPPTSPPTTGSNPGYVTTIFDPAGLVLDSSTAAGDTTAYAYDAAGDTLTTTDPRGEVTTNCYYDENASGQCAHSAPSSGGIGAALYSTTTPATTADPSGETSTYTYFAGGAVDTSTTPGATATDAYDPAGDLQSTTYSGIGSGYSTPANTSATYNVDGTIHTTTDATGTTTYGYDAVGDVTSQALTATGGLSNATTSYSYYTTGIKATVTYPAYGSYSSPGVTYTYDATGAMATSLDWLGNTVNFTHDADGNTTNQANNVSTSNPNGTSSTASTYDNADLPSTATTRINQTCGGAENVTQSFSGSTGGRNPDGQLTSETTSYSATCSGQATSTLDYSYNTAGQVTYQGTTAQGASPANFGYDASGDPTTLSSHSAATLDTYTQAYDAAGEVTSQTPIAGSGGSTTNYTYDTLGDQTQASGGTAATYAYNGAGQMASATNSTSGATTTYLYNAQGLEAAATTRTTAWGTPVDVNSTRSVNATTCVSSTFCVAVGASGYAVTYNGTSWSTPVDADSTRNLDAVSCTSSTFCVAVDTSGYATIYNGSTWSSPSHIDGSRSINAVTCTSSTFCMAVGASGYAIKYTGSWDSASHIDSTRSLSAVSCTSSSFCMAADSSGYAVTYTGSWGSATDIDGSRSISAVSCTSTTFCVAVDANGYAAKYTGTWASASDVDSSRAIKALACPSSTLCVAVDASGYALTYNGSAWTTPVDADGSRALDALSCTSTTFCAAADTAGYETSYNGTSWSTPTDIDAARSVSSVSCISSTFCGAVDTSGYGTLYATGPSNTSQLTWDLTSTLPNTLSDGTYDYLYGPDGTPVEEIALATSTPTYLSFTASDSTWLSTNEAGDLTGIWSYDAFGTLANGTPTSAFGYSGQYTDATTGFGVNRARDYNSATGSFTTRDPAFATTDTAYTFGGGDPVNGGDPTGLCTDSHGIYLVPGPCEFSNSKWVSQALNNIHAQYAPPPWWERGLEGDADFFAGAANAVVSGVTLGAVHISVPFCQYSWAYGVGGIYAFAAVAALGVGELDAPAALEAVDEVGGVEAPAVFEGAGDLPQVEGASQGLDLQLQYKEGWTPEQIAAADSKVDALNTAAQNGELSATPSVRSGTSAASMFRRAGEEVPAGSDIDHIIDLQLGGANDLSNLAPLDSSVNRSLGAQIACQIKNVAVGTTISSVSIC